MDFTQKLTEAVAKAPQLQSPVSQVTYSRDYLDSCCITIYYMSQSKILDAQFLSISEDETMQMQCVTFGL